MIIPRQFKRSFQRQFQIMFDNWDDFDGFASEVSNGFPAMVAREQAKRRDIYPGERRGEERSLMR
jgi:hypothetical protein